MKGNFFGCLTVAGDVNLPVLFEQIKLLLFQLHGLAQLFLNVYQTLAKKQTAADPGAWTVIKEYLHTFFPNIAATGLGVTDTAAVLQGVPLTEEHFFPQLKSYLDNQFNKARELLKRGELPFRISRNGSTATLIELLRIS